MDNFTAYGPNSQMFVGNIYAGLNEMGILPFPFPFPFLFSFPFLFPFSPFLLLRLFFMSLYCSLFILIKQDLTVTAGDGKGATYHGIFELVSLPSLTSLSRFFLLIIL